jgi:hypothetical protein
MCGSLRHLLPPRRRLRSTSPCCCPPLLQFKVPPATSAIITNGEAAALPQCSKVHELQVHRHWSTPQRQGTPGGCA